MQFPRYYLVIFLHYYSTELAVKEQLTFFSTKKGKNKLGSQTTRDKQITTLMEEIQPNLL